MKFALSATLFLFAASAYAEPDAEQIKPPKKHPLDQGGRDKLRPLEFWKKADVNNDRQLSREEFVQLPRISQLPPDKQEKLFAHLDKNNNNVLEPDEMIPGPGGNGGNPEETKKRPFLRLAEMDKNGDKKIEFDEFVQSPFIAKLPAERQKKMFEIMDRNKDGVLSPADGPPPGSERRPEGDAKKPPMFNAQQSFSTFDANKDGTLGFAEFQQAPFARGRGEDAQEDLFEKIDTNDDLKIDPQEMQRYGESAKTNPNKEQPFPHDKPKKPKQEHPADEEMIMENGA
jgi:Ca2+-binding EF-hand superfamily protein